MPASVPKFSIITIVYNREQDIEYTLNSVISQTYNNIEYIVIDGGSTDDTLNIINRYRDQMKHFISEKDDGIYDAMNKGLHLATGDYVLFINGGDQLHQINTIEDIYLQNIKGHTKSPDIIFGECMLIDSNRNPIQTRSQSKNQVLSETLHHRSFIHGTTVSHQSFIVKKEIAPYYNLQYKWSSDVDWMLNCIKKARTKSLFPQIISDFVIGDSSEKHKLKSLIERFKIMQKHYGLKDTVLAHIHLLSKN